MIIFSIYRISRSLYSLSPVFSDAKVKVRVDLDGALALDIVHHHVAAIEELVAQDVDVRLLPDGLQISGPQDSVASARTQIEVWATEASEAVINDEEGAIFWAGLHDTDEVDRLRAEAARLGVSLKEEQRAGTVPTFLLRGRQADINTVRDRWQRRLETLPLYTEVAVDSREFDRAQSVALSHVRHLF